MYKALLHTHSYGIKEEKYLSELRTDRIINTAFQENIDVLCITNMNVPDTNIEDLLAHPRKQYDIKDMDSRGIIIKRRSDSKTLYLLRGIELFHKEGHLLAIGYQRDFN